MKLKLLALSMLAATNVYATQAVNVTAVANQAAGIANQNTQATGFATYSITNNASGAQSYTVDAYMCINNGHCTHYHDQFALNSHQSVSHQLTLYANATLAAGNYEDECTIQITGAEQGYAKGTNSVVVR